jgi:hypothetical protein
MRPVRPGGRYWFRLQPRTVPPIPSARAPEAGSTDQPTPGQEDGTTLNPAPKLVAGTADWPAPERAAGTALYPRSQTVQGTRPAPAPAAGTVREAGAEPGDGTARYGADRRLRQASNCPWITNRAAGYGQRRPDRHGGDEPRSHTNPCTNHQCLSKPDRTTPHISRGEPCEPTAACACSARSHRPRSDSCRGVDVDRTHCWVRGASARRNFPKESPSACRPLTCDSGGR